MRVVIYTGKGGVGKTSVAAATALGAAARGHTTLVISTDNAHSLGDSLGVPLGPDPTPVRPNLFGLEVDVLTELARNWGEVHRYLLALLASQGVEEITAEEVVILPGMELITALLLLDQVAEERRFDTVVLDTAPTADTLRLLSFPNAVEWYFDHLFGLQRRIARVARATVGRAMKTPIPPDAFFDSVQKLHGRFQRVRALLTDPRQTTVRLVVNPEKMVIAETQRAFTYLCLFGFAVELLVVNRVFPTAATSGYFAGVRTEQAANLATLTELFGEIPQLPVPRYPAEVVGVPALEQLERDLFGSSDPVKLRPTVSPIRFLERGGHPVIELALPYTGSDTVDLSQRGDTLYLRVGAYRRSIVLPYAFTGRAVDSANLVDGTFTIHFSPRRASKTLAHAAS
jgi:arsenite/tail-anchored protein-transporting ATPase